MPKVVEPCYKIKVDGSNMPEWMYSCCTKVCFKETSADGANETLEIYFDDPELNIMESGLFVEQKTKISCSMGTTDKVKELFYGIVQDVENDYPKNGRITLKIVARDISYMMNKDDVTKTWKGLTYSDIVTKICEKYGLKTITDDTVLILPRSTGASTEEVKEEAKEESKGATYTVVKGDCLWNIAKKYYGSGAQYTKIYNANKNVIKNPNLIYPGQVLTIPDAKDNSNETATEEPTISGSANANELVTVNQNGITDLKFIQNIANKISYKLRFDSVNRLCYFVKRENLPKGETVTVHYKEDDEELLAFKPKYNNYDKAMKVVASNYNIANNEIVSSMTMNETVVEEPTPKDEKPKAKSSSYTVKSGDCLWNIAKQFYGNGSQYTKIYDANKNIIKNPNLIYPGQVLVIPMG